MVTVVNIHQRESKTGSFIALELLGDPEIVQSQVTGRMYATARRCTIPSSFDEATARLMVGRNILGTIERVQAEPYDYTIPESGEVIKLAHTYQYVPEKAQMEFSTVPAQLLKSKSFKIVQ